MVQSIPLLLKIWKNNKKGDWKSWVWYSKKKLKKMYYLLTECNLNLKFMPDCVTTQDSKQLPNTVTIILLN